MLTPRSPARLRASSHSSMVNFVDSEALTVIGTNRSATASLFMSLTLSATLTLCQQDFFLLNQQHCRRQTHRCQIPPMSRMPWMDGGVTWLR